VKKATIEFTDNRIIVDGMSITLDVIPQILYELAHPDPRKWYRFERVNGQCIVHVEMRDPAGPVRECPRCGFNTTAHYSFCPYHGETLVPGMEVNNGNYVGQRSRSSEDAGSEGQEAANPHNEHIPN
jgi:hypothetical protein